MKQSVQETLMVHTKTLDPLTEDIESVWVCSEKKSHCEKKNCGTYLRNLLNVNEVLQNVLSRFQRTKQ